MKKLIVIALVTTLFAAPQHIANGDPMIEEGRWYFTPMATYVFREDKSRFTNGGPGGQFGFARGFKDNWAVEFSFIGNELSGDNQHTIGQYGVGVDLLHTMQTDSSWSPYWVLGTGYMKSRSNEEGNFPPYTPDSDNAIGSAAIGLAHPVGDTSGIFRTEIRYRADFADDETFGDFLFNIGFTVPMGPTEAPPVILDSDNDGVMDPDDLCPGTAANADVDTNGCELDSDKDGV